MRARADIAKEPVGQFLVEPVADTEDLSSVLLTEIRPGEQVTLTVVRDGRRTNVTTTVTDRPDPAAATPTQAG